MDVEWSMVRTPYFGASHIVELTFLLDTAYETGAHGPHLTGGRGAGHAPFS